MPSVFWVFILISLVHIGEEYFFPGGFLDFMRRVNPRFAPAITEQFAITMNSAFLLLLLAAVLVGESSLLLSLSAAALLFINGLVHAGSAVVTRYYVPGLISGLLLYIPVSTTAFFLYLCAGKITPSGVAFAFLLGLLYQMIPFVFIRTRNRLAS
jgi:hypothetical protein